MPRARSSLARARSGESGGPLSYTKAAVGRKSGSWRVMFETEHTIDYTQTGDEAKLLKQMNASAWAWVVWSLVDISFLDAAALLLLRWTL
jgi:hypothetical protein